MILTTLFLTLLHFFSPVTALHSHLHQHGHHRDHVREFSCGKLYYRTFFMDGKRDVLYVGGMDRVFRLALSNVNRSRCDSDSISLDPGSMNNCISKGKSSHFDCRNHIRVIQMVQGSKLYVCGTNAHAPRDWILHTNLTHLSPHESYPGIGNGVAKCPFDPEDNSTAVWVEEGNPGGLPGLYSGSPAEFTKADTVIFRTDLYNTTTGQKVHPFKRTIKYDSKWLDKPNFVGSFDVGDYVFFFFRENAVEYINCGKNIYSRIGRVCKRDMGGKNILSKNWASFLKARLNCSIPGEFPFYFNEIQHVFKHSEDETKFFAVFSTNSNGLMGSAICTFSLDAIQEVFNGKFKEQATSSSAWLPVLSSKVPEPRPGSCVNDTQSLSDSVLNFIRGHPLMDSSVPQDNGRPAFYKRDAVFTKIVVDFHAVEGIRYTTFFAGTTTGLIYKVVEWMDHRKEEVQSNLVDVFEATTPEPVRALELSSKHKSLYVASDTHVRQFDLFSCKIRHESCIRCIRDPYCGWDRSHGECRPYTSGLIQDVDSSYPTACDGSIKQKDMKVNFGQTAYLSCPMHTNDLETTSKHGSLKWIYYRNERSGVEVTNKKDKYALTTDNGLVILGTTEREAGRYECKLGPLPLIRYEIFVDPKSCIASNEADFRRVYSDWCHEFEKYKSAMKAFQIKQSKCLNSSPGNDLSSVSA